VEVTSPSACRTAAGTFANETYEAEAVIDGVEREALFDAAGTLRKGGR
jgi:hypothetical protein